MIQNALQFTQDILQQYLKHKLGLDKDLVVCNKIIETDGSVPIINQNKVVLSFINIERESFRPFVNKKKQQVGSYAAVVGPEHFNLDVLVSCNFDHYNEALKFLNEVILFFQINHYFHPSIASNIPEGISKLSFELKNITSQEMHQLWHSMGATYQPSVIYKLRLVTINPQEHPGFVSAVSETSNVVK
jgi:hypothetical protein